MKSNTKHLVVSLALALLGGSAFAAGGSVTTVSASPNAVFPNETVNLKVGVTQGSFGIDCKMRWSVRDTSGIEIKGNNVKVQSSTASAEYAVGFSMPSPGTYVVEAMPGSPDSQTTSCQGKVSTSLTVKDKNAISANPGLMVSPGAMGRPATPVMQMPGVILQVTTLTAIKQVPYTNNGGETWIEVQGSGNCNFTIESAGVPAASFSSSAVKPFPVKVKIPGAPLGSHLWTAKGTGNCNGSANTTFSVS